MRAFLQTMRFRRLLTWSVVVLVVLLVLSAASATGARPTRAGAGCTSGASSVRAEKVNGRIVATTPVVTGCAPR